MNRLFPLLFLSLMQSVAFSQEKDSVVTLPEVVITAEWMINEQVDRSFAAKFPESYDIIWRKLNKDYLIKFIEGDVKHQSVFRKNGSIKYDIIYVNESHLPKKITDIVNRAYSDYIIKNGARIERGTQEFWIVNLEGNRSYIVVRVENDEIEQVRKIIKSTP